LRFRAKDGEEMLGARVINELRNISSIRRSIPAL